MKNKFDDIKQRTEIYKLIIAKDAISQAHEVATIMIDRGIDHESDLFRPLHDALVVNYGKAFSSMNPFGKIDKSWGVFSDTSSQLAHKRIIDQRNKNVGHRDFIPEGVMIYQKGAIMPGGDVAPRVQNEILHRFIAPDDIRFVRKMAADLIYHMSIAISDRMEELYGEEGVLIKGALELIAEKDAKVIEAENRRKAKFAK